MAKNNFMCCRSDNVFHQTFPSNTTQICLLFLFFFSHSSCLLFIYMAGIHYLRYKELGNTKASGKEKNLPFLLIVIKNLLQNEINLVIQMSSCFLGY